MPTAAPADRPEPGEEFGRTLGAGVYEVVGVVLRRLFHVAVWSSSALQLGCAAAGFHGTGRCSGSRRR
ncbi:hypothetical protein ACFVZ8_26740 [Streptomyces sp. NPDC059558]|uniref:hypothetical protein n=1 Tax=Streptomyces sp. NPDC059558 TaxID=3346864 RepID=UPI0036BA795C